MGFRRRVDAHGQEIQSLAWSSASWARHVGTSIGIGVDVSTAGFSATGVADSTRCYPGSILITVFRMGVGDRLAAKGKDVASHGSTSSRGCGARRGGSRSIWGRRRFSFLLQIRGSNGYVSVPPSISVSTFCNGLG